MLSEAQLDESVRPVLRDKFALGLFENPYVAEDPVEIRSRAGEGDELSRRMSDDALTLLKNDGGLLPLGRDVRKVAVIGPHADSVMVGFPQYSYPAGVAMIRVAAKLGFFPMPGVGELPKEGVAALTTELERAQGDVEELRAVRSVEGSNPSPSASPRNRMVMRFLGHMCSQNRRRCVAKSGD